MSVPVRARRRRDFNRLRSIHVTAEGRWDTLYTLRLKLKNLLHKTRVRIEVVDADGAKSIYEHMHDSGDEPIITTRRKQKTGDF